MSRHERHKRKKAVLNLSIDGHAFTWEDGREVQAGDLVAGRRYTIALNADPVEVLEYGCTAPRQIPSRPLWPKENA